MTKLYTAESKRLCNEYIDMYKQYKKGEVTLNVLLELEKKLKLEGMSNMDIYMLITSYLCSFGYYNTGR